jgi:predicted GTPase
VDPKIYIIANKRDLEDKRVVSSERLIDYASKEGVKFYEISARDGFGIKEMFIDIATDLTSYEPQKSPNKLYIKDEDD